MSLAILDPLTLPLRGARLIEASAGTGKTWTIAALYVRLVLGLGAPRALLPAEILVMTFTRAATRELAERIRARLAEAGAVLRGERAPADPFLAGLLSELPPAQHLEAAWRLTLAAQSMDEAAVHTIDAWCQKVLREHALASGSPLEELLVADEAALLHEAVRDWWRQQVYPLGPDAFALWQAQFPDVERLASDVRRTLALLDLAAGVEPAPADLGAWLLAERDALLAAKAGWDAGADAIEAWLMPLLALEGKAKLFSGAKLRPDWLRNDMEALRRWARDPALETLEWSDAARRRYTADGIAEALTKGATTTWPPVIDRVAGLLDTLDDRLPLRPRLLLAAAQAVAARLAELKQRQQLFGFADPLQRLEAALAGPLGETLRQRLLASYPVALVDEFQDTAPRQYRLFERLYRPRDQHQDTALLLIGDPKQSIYGFRGADIYSYLRARDDTHPNHDALGTNHRSSAAVVAAVNQLFEQAEAGRPGGAFALHEGHWTLPFTPVRAQGRAERFVATAGPVPALTVRHADAAQKAGELRRRFAALAAEQVVGWLNDPACGFAEADRAFQRLRPADVAVLVRDRKEATAVRRALQARGVASVYLSDQASVFATAEAVDLLRWLEAVAQPLDGRRARAAYASATFGLTWEDLAAQAQDEAAWDDRVALLRELHGRWQQQGVLAMLRLTLHRLQLPARRLAQPEGERSLTNVLHLAELLQRASTQLEGEAALARWLAERIAEAHSGQGDDAGLGDERIVRLESDAGLVQVITVHKSKGLEYPVVLLPFAASCSRDDSTAPLLARLHEDGRRSLDMAPDKALRDAVQRERLREDLRLLYVALTRARHALWLGVGLPGPRQPPLHGSALGHLLGLEKGTDGAQLSAALQRAWAPCEHSAPAGQPVVQLQPAPDTVAVTPLQRGESAPPLLAPAPYAAVFERRWSVGSYTSVVRGHATVDLGSVQRRDELEEADDAAPPRRAEPASWHAFPRGATPGNFLHDQLQWLAELGFGALDEVPVQDALRRRCERAGHGERADTVLAWMQALVHTPLPALGAPLAALHTRVPELEFWMPVEALSAPRLDALCGQHLLPGLERPALPQRELRGLLMGFADLVFEHGGRYWVLDYKSNALGDEDGAYGPAALRAAMVAHRYDVQAALYTAALHRLLRERLREAYEPARQLGGALYLFLRGIQGRERGCVHLPPSMALLDAIDSMLDGSAP